MCRLHLKKVLIRTMDRAMDRAMDRTTDRPMDRTMDRTMDRAMDRAMDRTMDRTMDETTLQQASVLTSAGEVSTVVRWLTVYIVLRTRYSTNSTVRRVYPPVTAPSIHTIKYIAP